MAYMITCYYCKGTKRITNHDRSGVSECTSCDENGQVELVSGEEVCHCDQDFTCHMHRRFKPKESED